MIGWHEPDTQPLKDLAQMLTSQLPDGGELPATWHELLGPNRESLFTQAIDNWFAYEESRGVLIGDDRKQVEQLIGDEYAKAYKDIASSYNNQSLNILNQDNLRLSKIYSKAYQSVIKSYTGTLSPLQQKEAVKKAIIQSLILEVDRGITQWLIDKLMRQSQLKEAIAYFKSLKNARLAQSAITALAALDLEMIQRAQRDALIQQIQAALESQNKYIKSLSDTLSDDIQDIKEQIQLCDTHIAQLQTMEEGLQQKLDGLGEQLERMAFQAQEQKKEIKQVQAKKKEQVQVRQQVEDEFTEYKKEAEDLDKRSDQVEALMAQKLEKGAIDSDSPQEQQQVMDELKQLESKMLEVEPIRKGFQDIKAQLELMMGQNVLSPQQVYDFYGRAQRLAEKYPDVEAFAQYQQHATHMMTAFVNKPSMQNQLIEAGLLEEPEVLRAESAVRLMEEFKAMSDAAQMLERDFVVEADEQGQFQVTRHDGSPQDAAAWLEEKVFAPFRQIHGEDSLAMSADEFIAKHLQAKQLQAEHDQDPSIDRPKYFYIHKSTQDTLFNLPIFSLGLEQGNVNEVDRQHHMPWLNLKEQMEQDEAKFYEFKRAFESKNESLALLVQKQVEEEIQDIYQNYETRLSTIDGAIGELDQTEQDLKHKLEDIQSQYQAAQDEQNELQLALMLVNETKEGEVKLKSLYERELDFAKDLQDLYNNLQESNNQIMDFQRRIQQATDKSQIKNLERNLASIEQQKKDITSQINHLVRAKTTLNEQIATLKEQQTQKFDQIAKLQALEGYDMNAMRLGISAESMHQSVFQIIQSIAQDFHPTSGMENSNQRVKSLVERASDQITQSGVLEGITDEQREKVYNFLESQELNQRIYQIALKARIDYFYPLMMQNYKQLASPQGLDWLEYPRARRDVIDGLIEKLHASGQMTPGQVTQIKEFLVNQKAKALQEDIAHIDNREELQVLAERIRSGDALQYMPGFLKEDMIEKLQAKEAELALTHHIPNRRSLVYSSIHTPEHHLTQGIKADLQKKEAQSQVQPTLKDKSGPSPSR